MPFKFIANFLHTLVTQEGRPSFDDRDIKRLTPFYLYEWLRVFSLKLKACVYFGSLGWFEYYNAIPIFRSLCRSLYSSSDTSHLPFQIFLDMSVQDYTPDIDSEKLHWSFCQEVRPCASISVFELSHCGCLPVFSSCPQHWVCVWWCVSLLELEVLLVVIPLKQYPTIMSDSLSPYFHYLDFNVLSDIVS